MGYSAKNLFYRCLNRLRKFYLPRKQYKEWLFWKQIFDKCIKWYTGDLEVLYTFPAPTEDMKVTEYTLPLNAIYTWVNTRIDRYPKHLNIPRDYFKGLKILDVGCGPFPLALSFVDCDIYGLDPLIDEYKKIGFPLESYSNRLKYLKAAAENMPVKDNFFDAVISVNAIDHVDDLPTVAKEIGRVLKPDGILRMIVHYHEPTVCEPWSLNDDKVMEHFGQLGIKKVYEHKLSDFPSGQIVDSKRRQERLVVWSNYD